MTTICESCSMPMATAEDHSGGDPSSPWCRHCAPDGELQPFEERFERMVQWAVRKDGLDRAEAEVRTRAYMRTLPAWKDHPALA
jgi:hypothetical protein